MLDARTFVDAVVEETGMEVLAHAEGYCSIGDGSVPRIGILCGVQGGLVFIAERRGVPGPISLWGRGEVQDAEVSTSGALAGLSFVVGGKRIAVSGLPEPPLLRIVAASGLLLRKKDDSPEFVGGLEEAIISTTPPPTAQSAPLNAPNGSSYEFDYGAEDTSEPPKATPIYGGASSLIESSVGMPVGYDLDVPIYGGATSLMEARVGATVASGSSIYGGGISLIEATIGTAGFASDSGTTINYGAIGGPVSLLESAVGDARVQESGHIHEVVPSMIETEIDAEGLQEIRAELRKREEERRKVSRAKEPLLPAPVIPPPLPQPSAAKPAVGLPASALLQDPEDLEFLDPTETVVIETNDSTYHISLDRFVRRIEDGHYGPDVMFKLARSRRSPYTRLGDTPLYLRMSPRVQEFEDEQQLISPQSRSAGKAWRYVGLGLGALGGLVFTSGVLGAAFGGLFGYVIGRIFGVIVVNASAEYKRSVRRG
ncbi:MAG: hypothetical protein A2289_19290 [Deltaproteobacteria bacterium RIFOXYA12_FULL_58_15]|nr:MAG: hypothetical protein A2289_19290 [Deltaproteobacteria bacterium RIFOXYA12_FULL_58_15]